MLEVTDAPCHTSLVIIIIIITLVSTRSVRLLPGTLSYHCSVTRHILNVNECPELVRYTSRLRHNI